MRWLREEEKGIMHVDEVLRCVLEEQGQNELEVTSECELPNGVYEVESGGEASKEGKCTCSTDLGF